MFGIKHPIIINAVTFFGWKKRNNSPYIWCSAKKSMRNLDDEKVCLSNERFFSMAFSNPTSGYNDAKKNTLWIPSTKKRGLTLISDHMPTSDDRRTHEKIFRLICILCRQPAPVFHFILLFFSLYIFYTLKFFVYFALNSCV